MPMNLIRIPASLLLVALFLSACGQKGPLYLPGNPDGIRSEIPTTNDSTAPDEDDSQDDDDDELQR